MSFDVGCGGMWGFPVTAEVIGQPLMDSINRYLAILDAREGIVGSEAVDKLHPRYEDRVRQRFLENAGIIIPEAAHFGISESEDTSMGRQYDGYSVLYIGFSMYLAPWQWPELDESFKAKAILYTWVWGG